MQGQRGARNDDSGFHAYTGGMSVDWLQTALRSVLGE